MEPSPISDPSGKPRPWSAQWIQLPDDRPGTNLRTLFQGQFTCPEDGYGGLTRIHITARDRYVLRVNGHEIGQGPPAAAPWYYYFDTYDLSEFIQEGDNSLEVVVYRLGEPEAAVPMLLAEVVGESGRILCATGAGWFAKRPAAWDTNTHHFFMHILSPYQEFFDGRQDPSNSGEVAKAGENGWQGASVYCPRKTCFAWSAGGISKLVPRDIPHLRTSFSYPRELVCAEESVELAHRTRPGDASVSLSTPGVPLRHAKVESIERLLGTPKGTDRPATLTCGQPDRRYRADRPDGRYNPCVTLDFGTLDNGFVEIEIEAAEGAEILIGVAERLVDGHFFIANECPFAVKYTCRRGRQVWKTADPRTFRFLRIRVENSIDPVRIFSIRRIDWRYPMADSGSFTCSDPEINKLFAASRRTLQLCSLEALVDTPWREGAQWLGDVAAVTVGGLYSCFGETRLPGKFLRQSMALQRPDGLIASMTNQADLDRVPAYADYSLWWIFAAWQHRCYTGNAAWQEHLFPTACRILQALQPYEDADHVLCQSGFQWFIDHADVDLKGTSAVCNALYYMALGIVQTWAQEREDRWWTAYTRQRRDRMLSAFGERFWNDKRGLFSDIAIDTRQSPHFSEHSNMAAVAFGLTTSAQTNRILDNLYPEFPDDVAECEPFFTSVVLRALERAGRFDLGLHVIRERWIRRQIRRGAETVWEEWGLNGSWRNGTFSTVMRTNSHAWSAYPAEFLSRALAGVDFLNPKAEIRTSACVELDYEILLPFPSRTLRASCSGKEFHHEWILPEDPGVPAPGLNGKSATYRC